MRIELEREDIEAIAIAVIEKIKPLFGGKPGKEVDDILDVQTVASYLNVKPTWVYKQIEYKAIPHFHAGKYPRFRRSEIDAWTKTHATPAASAPYPRLKVVNR